MMVGLFCRSLRSFSSSKPSIRLSKWLSEQLLVSRREAERTIRSGEVRLAGIPLPAPAALVAPNDLASLTVNGKKVNIKESNSLKHKIAVWLIHKRRGELVTANDPKGRPMVVPPIRNGVFVGRLDMNTEGLLLCTNSGEYARELELPVNQYHRTYRVRVYGKLDEKKLRALERGIRVDRTTRYSGMKVVLETKKFSNATNQWLEITCVQGQNRQIRNALQHIGCKSLSMLLNFFFNIVQINSERDSVDSNLIWRL